MNLVKPGNEGVHSVATPNGLRSRLGTIFNPQGSDQPLNPEGDNQWTFTSSAVCRPITSI